jgi:hypothetical protein
MARPSRWLGARRKPSVVRQASPPADGEEAQAFHHKGSKGTEIEPEVRPLGFRAVPSVALAKDGFLLKSIRVYPHHPR